MDSQSAARELVQPAYAFIFDKLLPIIGWEAYRQNLARYWEYRSQSPQVLVDAFPAMACLAGNGNRAAITPTLAAWVLFLLSGRLMDDIADAEGRDEEWHEGGAGQSLQFSVSSIGLANVALTYLMDQRAACEIGNAFNRTLALAAKSQAQELTGATPMIQSCLQAVTAKTGLIFAVGAWAGARAGAVVGGAEVEDVLYQYGLNAGIMTQLLDDYVDLDTDLQQGVWTLPLAHGLSQSTHVLYPQLLALWQERERTRSWAGQVKNLLMQMGSLDQTLHLAATYQEQAVAVLRDMPTKQKSLLTAYVTQSYLPTTA